MLHHDNLALHKLFIYSYSGYRKPCYYLARRNVELINFHPRPNLKAYIYPSVFGCRQCVACEKRPMDEMGSLIPKPPMF